MQLKKNVGREKTYNNLFLLRDKVFGECFVVIKNLLAVSF